MLRSPPVSVLSPLAASCRNTTVAIRNYVFEMMFDVRKSISMRDYVTFLIDAMDLNDETNSRAKKNGVTTGTANGMSKIIQNDDTILQSCHFIVKCGGVKTVGNMLTPILSHWISSRDNNKKMNILSLMRLRAVLCVLSTSIKDAATVTMTPGWRNEAWGNNVSQLMTSLASAVIKFWEWGSWSNGDSEKGENKLLRRRLLDPLVVSYSNCVFVFRHVLVPNHDD